MTGSRDYERIAEAIAWLDARPGAVFDLGGLAAHLALSPAHTRRLFQRWAGISPLRFVQSVRAIQAQAALRDQATVLDASYAAGLSGPGRLHGLLTSVDAVTPGEVRALGRDLVIRRGWHDSPFGSALVGLTSRGVVHLAFHDMSDSARSAAEQGLLDLWPAATHIEDVAATRSVADLLPASATASEVGAPTLSALVRGTNLQVQVWRALLRIPPGQTVSYGSVARAIGRPTAARAVASAIGRNPIACLIPCHRVLRQTGAVGGYRWGVARKRALLARELVATEPTLGGLSSKS